MRDIIDKIVKDVKTGLFNMQEFCNGGRSIWTSQINCFLATIAEDCNLECTYTDKRSLKKEWLYDFVIYSVTDDSEYKPEWKRFNKAYLVAESEWNTDLEAIQEDFEKLVVAKSPVKLMIYSVSENKEKKNEISCWLKRIACCSEMNDDNEIYILAACVGKDEKFEIEIRKDGEWQK
jgi:hypothetical protein